MNELDNLKNFNNLPQKEDEIKTLELDDLNSDLREPKASEFVQGNPLGYCVDEYYIELQRLAENNDLMTGRMYKQTVRLLVKGLQKQYAFNYSIFKENASHHYFEKFCFSVKNFFKTFFKWTVFLPITLVILIFKQYRKRKLKKQRKQKAK